MRRVARDGFSSGRGVCSARKEGNKCARRAWRRKPGYFTNGRASLAGHMQRTRIRKTGRMAVARPKRVHRRAGGLVTNGGRRGETGGQGWVHKQPRRERRCAR